jgi:hypothetical protein
MYEQAYKAINELRTMGITVYKLDDSSDGPLTFNYSIHTPDGERDASITTLVQWRDHFRHELNEKVAHMYDFGKLLALWNDLLKDRELVLRGNEMLYSEAMLGLIRGAYDFENYQFSGQLSDDYCYFKLLI